MTTETSPIYDSTNMSVLEPSMTAMYEINPIAEENPDSGNPTVNVEK